LAGLALYLKVTAVRLDDSLRQRETNAGPVVFEQSVLILVDNAANYVPAGGRIALTSAARSGELRVGIEDHDPGVPEEKLPRIFESFLRLDKALSRELAGAGLGLPIAKTIVEATAAMSRP